MESTSIYQSLSKNAFSGNPTVAFRGQKFDQQQVLLFRKILKIIRQNLCNKNVLAWMAELADALDSKSGSFARVRVRPPLQVPMDRNL